MDELVVAHKDEYAVGAIAMKSNNLINTFLSTTTKKEIATVLGIKYSTLCYYLYVFPEKERYSIFDIPKKNGNIRQIVAPVSGLKRIQRKLASILQDIYPDKYCVYGFLKEKNIKLNASKHTGHNIIINIDLKDFFHSINFGRVLGIFKSPPFNFNKEVAVTLAQICCYNNSLPQGAPTSPIISNYVCRRLDNDLLRFARKIKMVYTRYADDITFSTNLKEIPPQLGFIKEAELLLSNELKNIIENNDFEINGGKTRYAFKNNRQEVTGLTVNKFPNVNRKFVRNIRAMLHAWEKYGVEDAATEYFEKYKKVGKPENQINTFIKVAVGRINFLRHIQYKENIGDSQLYRRFYSKVQELYPEAKLTSFRQYITSATDPVVLLEGISDRIHLKEALKYFHSKGKFMDLSLNFPDANDYERTNNTKLLNFCEAAKNNQYQYPQKIISLFDRDDKSVNNKHPGKYINWGQNVFSALIPKPIHRDFDEICIEFYFPDEMLKLKDESDRRLYISTEFDKNTGGLLGNENIYYKKPKYLQEKYPRILDSNVFKKNDDGSETSLGLSKIAFASKCAAKKGNFKDVSYDNFESIFSLLHEIVYQ